MSESLVDTPAVCLPDQRRAPVDQISVVYEPIRSVRSALTSSNAGSAELAPVDEFGIPYLIYPFEERDLPRWITEEPEYMRTDDDHSWYCRDNPNLVEDTAGIGGLSLRYSRTQTGNRGLHAAKHHLFGGGLKKYPETIDEQFAELVLLGGGYAPRLAWDFRDPSNPVLKTMSKRVYSRVREPDSLHLAQHPSRRHLDDEGRPIKTGHRSRVTIGKFFAEYAVAKGLSFLDETVISELLDTRSPKKRMDIGRQIIMCSIDCAVGPINEFYLEAFDAQGAKPRFANPRGVVTRHFSYDKWPDYFHHFEILVRIQRGLTLAVD